MQAKLRNAYFVSIPVVQRYVVVRSTPNRRRGEDGRRSRGEGEGRRQKAQRRSRRHSSQQEDREEPCRSRSLRGGHHHRCHHRAHHRSGRRGSGRHVGRSRRVCHRRHHHRSRGPIEGQ